ncbi:MAG: PEP-CTERM sorting domain-containing protein [Sphingobium sp.]|nr:PEP-CTERM sorting domain-containing protein [Sphingobium sp.]
MPAHTAIKLSFLVGLLDSWDSTNGSPAPDLLFITIDGNLVATLTTNNASGSVTDFGGGTLIVNGAQVDSNQFYTDTLLDMSSAPWTSFAHSASSITIGFQAGGAGWQGGTDEAWGVDNLTISVSSEGAVPEPASWAMMLGGLGIIGAAMRRRRTALSFG